MKINEQHMRVSKMMLQYYKDATIEPTIDDWKVWIENLKEPMKSGFREMGFEGCKTVLPFQRFYLELNEHGMRDYMRANLSKEDFAYYMSFNEKEGE